MLQKEQKIRMILSMRFCKKVMSSLPLHLKQQLCGVSQAYGEITGQNAI